MTFAEIVAKINAGQREPAGCTPPVCEIWQASDHDGKVLMNAILGFEVRAQRKVRAEDEADILALREKLKAGGAMADA